jgi:putative membrane protein
MKFSNYCLTALVAPGLFLLSGAAMAQDASTAKTAASSADTAFVMKAASGGMAEVELGKMAQEKGSSQAVKDFGKKMVDDHTKANDQLKQVASQKNITVPGDMMPKDKATVAKMSSLSGAAFDKAYVKDMVEDHKKDVAAFQKEANSGKDSDIKGFASQTLPTLQEHLKMIQDIASKKSM